MKIANKDINNNRDGMSVSLQKFNRSSLISSGTDKSNDLQSQQSPLPGLFVRGLKSAHKNSQSPQRQNKPIKFYVNELQCVLSYQFDDPMKNRQDHQQDQYVFVDSYLDALNYVTQEEKIKKFHSNTASIVSENLNDIPQPQAQPKSAFPSIPPNQVRERMRKYAEGKQRNVVKLYVSQPKRNTKTSVSILSQKSLKENKSQQKNHYPQKAISLHQEIPPQKCKVSAKRWCIFVKKNGEQIFKRAYGWQDLQISEVASITKIMTCYTTLKFLEEHRVKADQIKIKIPGHAECIDGTSAFLNAGGVLSAQQLMYGLMLPSGNDAALVLSFAIGSLMLMKKNDPIEFNRCIKGYIIDCEKQIERNKQQLRQLFLNKMNQHREDLKLTQSFYNSVHGLNDTKNVSCAENICRLIEQCIQIEDFMGIITTKLFKTYATDDNGNKATFYKWKNTNKLLKKQGWAGVKTGVTPNAGPCYSGYYKNDDQEVIIVVLNCSNLNQRFRDAEILLNSVK